jgi:hypothetical protein
MEGRLAAEVKLAEPWVNDTKYTPTMFRVWQPGSFGNLKVEMSGWYPHPEIPPTWKSVPLPDYFEPSAGTDQEAILIDHTNSQTRYCEFWGFRYEWEGDGPVYGYTPHARAGGCMDYDLYSHSGAKTWPYPLGVQASGLTFMPGIVTVEDWQSGVIDHEVQLVVPEACGTFRAPAVRTDGWGTPAENPRCFEYGTLYRLPASADCAPPAPPHWGSPPGTSANARLTRMVCEAAKKHGLRVSDRNFDRVTVRVENWQRMYADWSWDNGGQWTDPYGLSNDDRHLRWAFPWNELRVANG